MKAIIPTEALKPDFYLQLKPKQRKLYRPMTSPQSNILLKIIASSIDDINNRHRLKNKKSIEKQSTSLMSPNTFFNAKKDCELKEIRKITAQQICTNQINEENIQMMRFIALKTCVGEPFVVLLGDTTNKGQTLHQI